MYDRPSSSCSAHQRNAIAYPIPVCPHRSPVRPNSSGTTTVTSNDSTHPPLSSVCHPPPHQTLSTTSTSIIHRCSRRRRPQPRKRMPRRSKQLGARGPTAFSRQHPILDLIFNVVSGQRDPSHDLHLITSALTPSFTSVRIWKTTPEQGAQQLASQALSSSATLLVACGGDGTITAVASAIKSHISLNPQATPPILAIIPRGTANALCAALHIPTDVIRAADMVAAGPLRRLDFPVLSGAATTRMNPSASPGMLLLCGVGLEAETVFRADRRLKRALGAAAYAVAGINSIWRQRPFTTDLILHDVDDSLMFAQGVAKAGRLQLAGMQLHGVTIANAAPAASVLAQGIGEVRPDDGLLEVVCVMANHPLGMIRTMFSMLASALMRTREIRRNVYGLRARKVEIVCNPPQKVVVDGEDAGYTPVVIQLGGPGDSIQVIAPKAGTVNRRKRHLSRFLGRLARNVRGFVFFALTISLLSRRTRRLP